MTRWRWAMVCSFQRPPLRQLSAKISAGQVHRSRCATLIRKTNFGCFFNADGQHGNFVHRADFGPLAFAWSMEYVTPTESRGPVSADGELERIIASRG